jgi:hypothetical protein
MIARTQLGLILAALLLGAAGCQPTAYVLSKTLGPWIPEDEVEAQYSLKDRSVLILVDAKDPLMVSEHPRLRSALADAVGKCLAEQKACGPLVPSRSVEAARRADHSFSQWSVAQAGKYFNVDLVVHVEVLDFHVTDIGASNFFDGYVEAGVRVVDPHTGEQVWPVLSAAKVITGKTAPDVDAAQPAAQETILIDGYGEKLARLFYTYKSNDLPMRPKVE